MTALGHDYAGLFSNDDALASDLMQAGVRAREPVWRMPLHDSYRRDLDSPIADLKNCVDGSGHPDACQAAAFLGEFAGTAKWAHLDIAGTEFHAEASPRHAKGASGFGARLFCQLMELFSARGSDG